MFHVPARKIALLALALIPAMSFAAGGVTDVMTAKKALERWPAEGLTSIRVDGLDILYVNSKARLDDYRKVLLKPVTVAPNSDRRLKYVAPGTTRTLNLRPLMEATTTHVRDSISSALNAGGYALAETAAADVVEVTVSIVDVFLIAVNVKGSRNEQTESASLGNATLVVEVRDSTSGELILRSFDVEYGPESGRNSRRTGEDAEAWLLSTVDQWAGFLRKGLDVSNRNRSK